MNGKKYNKKNYLLTGGITNYTQNEKVQFKTDETGIYSMTSAKIAEQMTYDIIKLFSENYKIRVTDATASIGGNAIPFLIADNFSFVNIVEKNTLRFEMLKKNINIKKKKIIGKYVLFNKSYLKIYRDLKQDIVFIDPPWGGPDYYKYKNLILYLDEIHLGKICRTILLDIEDLKFIVIKTPKNFFISDFIEICGEGLCTEKMSVSKKLKKINIYKVYKQ